MTKVNLDKCSTSLRDQCEERPMCIQDLEISPGLAWCVVDKQGSRRNKPQKRDWDQTWEGFECQDGDFGALFSVL